jgi:glycerol dehydrogenase-like iron-containing ADH family enzyme
MSAKKTKKGRKHGRNKLFCQRYALENRAEKAKRKRMAKHAVRYTDTNTAKALGTNVDQLAYSDFLRRKNITREIAAAKSAR